MTGVWGAPLGWDRRRRVTPAGAILPAHDLSENRKHFSGSCVRPRPRKPGLKLSHWDDESLWREPWWNAGRRARPTAEGRRKPLSPWRAPRAAACGARKLRLPAFRFLLYVPEASLRRVG